MGNKETERKKRYFSKYPEKLSDKNRRYRTSHPFSKWLSLRPGYTTWSGMISRCSNPNDSSYKNYGGKGISVCGRWSTYSNFLKDMGARPDNHDLHRIDSTKGYFYENCIWLDHREHGRITMTK